VFPESLTVLTSGGHSVVIPIEPTDEIVTTPGGKTTTVDISPSPAHTAKVAIVTKDGGDTTVTVPSYPTT
jgi:hypothetical protein